MPWIEGGLPVTIDTLLGQVKLGMTHRAIALNPVSMKRATLGMIPFFSARSKYAGSPPSLQTTTTGRSGQRYSTPLRRIGGPGRGVISVPLHLRLQPPAGGICCAGVRGAGPWRNQPLQPPSSKHTGSPAAPAASG